METNEIVTNTERDAAVVTAPKADLSLLSNEPWLQENVNTFEQPKAEDKPNVDLEEKDKVEAANAGDLEIVKTPEELEAEKANTETEEKSTEVEDKPLEIEESVLEIDNNEAPEDSWLALAKSKNLEIAEDSLEAYEAAITAPLLSKIEEVKNSKVEDYLAEIDPNIRMEIELNKAGLTKEQIEAPFKDIQRYRSLNPVELVREDMVGNMLKLRDVDVLSEEDKAFIDTEIEKKVESGEINHDHKKLMLFIDSWEKQIKDERQEIVNKYKINSAKASEEKLSNEIASVSKALSETQSFMGSTIGKNSLTFVADKYSKGEYNQLLKDPKFIAKALLDYELGEKAYTAAIAKSEAKGRMSITKELHNTPPLDKVGAGKSTTTEIRTGLAALRDEPGLKN